MAAFVSLHEPHLNSRQRGLTVIELAVAMTLLTAGSAVLWYGLRSSLKLDKLNRIHHAALFAARSDLETVRVLSKGNVHDTAYTVSGPGGEPLRLVRQVFDSIRIMQSMRDIALDEKLAPLELRKPLEVKVQVLLNSETTEMGSGANAWSDFTDQTNPDGRVLITLILKLPEYQWH